MFFKKVLIFESIKSPIDSFNVLERQDRLYLYQKPVTSQKEREGQGY